jgi:hypothetical protein
MGSMMNRMNGGHMSVSTATKALIAGVLVLTTSAVMAAVTTTDAVAAVSGSHASVMRTRVTMPPGYTVVSNSYVNPAGAQTSGTADCPSPTVVWSGGVLTSSQDLAVSVNSSWPSSATEWDAVVNNGSASDENMTVYAVCADAPLNYGTATVTVSPVEPGQTVGSEVVCPKHTVVLGGGGHLVSASLSATLNASAPRVNGRAYSWLIAANNGSAPGYTFTNYAVCGKKPRKYSVQEGSSLVSNPAGTSTAVSAACPSGVVPIGGGIGETRQQPVSTIAVNATWPSAGAWSSIENNASTSSIDGGTVLAFAICAR